MKQKMMIIACIMLSSTLFVACKKRGTATTTITPSNNTFTMRNTVFNIGAAYSDSYSKFVIANNVGYLSNLGLTTDKNGGCLVYLFFYSNDRPTAGLYNVISGIPSAPNELSMTTQDSVSIAQLGIFNAVGTDHVKANIALDAHGKISITLPSTQLSGTNYDNTDPNNTLITTVNTTISGTFHEQ